MESFITDILNLDLGSIQSFLTSFFTANRTVAIIVCIAAFILAKALIKKALVVIFCIIGILAALYVVAPGLYSQVYEYIAYAIKSLADSM